MKSDSRTQNMDKLGSKHKGGKKKKECAENYCLAHCVVCKVNQLKTQAVPSEEMSCVSVPKNTKQKKQKAEPARKETRFTQSCQLVLPFYWGGKKTKNNNKSTAFAFLPQHTSQCLSDNKNTWIKKKESECDQKQKSPQ